jgi:hypothetical protein
VTALKIVISFRIPPLATGKFGDGTRFVLKLQPCPLAHPKTYMHELLSGYQKMGYSE